jgi:hypothetical protein
MGDCSCIHVPLSACHVTAGLNRPNDRLPTGVDVDVAVPENCTSAPVSPCRSCLVAIACLMRAKLARGVASHKEMKLFRQCLGAMGAVPCSRLSMPPPEEDPDDGLFQHESNPGRLRHLKFRMGS